MGFNYYTEKYGWKKLRKRCLMYKSIQKTRKGKSNSVSAIIKNCLETSTSGQTESTSSSVTTLKPTPIWPNPDTTKCQQNTKQKAMYGEMVLEPTLKAKPMINMSIQVKWDDLQFSPHNTNKNGGVYVAYVINNGDGLGGYFGIQLHSRGGMLLFSIWDGDRWDKSGAERVPKPSSKMVWPMNMEQCKRNCQDCGLPYLVPWKREGLTTGTQCKLIHSEMKAGDEYEITLERTKKQEKFNTNEYGGMPEAHSSFGEYDRDITGGVWVVKARKLPDTEFEEVGKILFEGDGRGTKDFLMSDNLTGVLMYISLCLLSIFPHG